MKRLIKEAHQNAIDRGFYVCPECEGDCEKITPDPSVETDMVRTAVQCQTCHGSGIDQNKNIGELLMLIVSELGEALEAHRCGRFANRVFLPDLIYFENNIKDTFEDEIADVFIRIFDLCGYLEIEDLSISTFKNFKDYSGNVGESLLYVSGMLCEMHIDKEEGSTDRDYICDTISLLLYFCKKWNINIDKHIEAKMAYNKTRPQKHGKKY